MASEMKWSSSIHPTEVTMVNSSETVHENESNEPSAHDIYEETKERYEEARNAYQIALEDLSQVHTETEKTRQTMIEAREAFIIAVRNDMIEEES